MLFGSPFSIKFDIASRQRRSFLGISIQFAKDFVIDVVHLGMVEMDEKHTADNIRRRIHEVILMHGLQIEQVYSCTTDNGANCIKASRDLLAEAKDRSDAANSTANEEDAKDEKIIEGTAADQTAEDDPTRVIEAHELECKPIRCAAHIVQLAVYDVLKRYECDIEDIRKCATAIRNRIISSYLSVPHPPRPNVTRWSSTLIMLRGC